MQVRGASKKLEVLDFEEGVEGVRPVTEKEEDTLREEDKLEPKRRTNCPFCREGRVYYVIEAPTGAYVDLDRAGGRRLWKGGPPLTPVACDCKEAFDRGYLATRKPEKKGGKPWRFPRIADLEKIGFLRTDYRKAFQAVSVRYQDGLEEARKAGRLAPLERRRT